MGGGASSAAGGGSYARSLPVAHAVRVGSINRAIDISGRHIVFDLDKKGLPDKSVTVVANRVDFKDESVENFLIPSIDAEGLITNADLLICAIKGDPISGNEMFEERLTPMLCAFIIQSCFSVHRVQGMPIAPDVILHIGGATLEELSVSGHLSLDQLNFMLRDIHRMFNDGELTLNL